nr:MAG TPA: hypothetical protein [Caudoviricetes sp.]
MTEIKLNRSLSSFNLFLNFCKRSVHSCIISRVITPCTSFYILKLAVT